MDEPVLGCSAGVWPALASFELLPGGSIPGSYGPELIDGLSANGEAVIGHTYEVVDPADPETSDLIPHPALFDGSSWQAVVPEAVSGAAVVNCDGSVVAGEYDRLFGFIKRTGGDPVILVGKGEWATVPRAISADGTRILGNLEYRGGGWEPLDPVIWTDLGAATYLWPAEPRKALHLTYDASLIAGHTDRCYFHTHCGIREDLFTSTGRPNETLYPQAPFAIMSSDGSTFADDRWRTPVDDLLYVVHLFRTASGLTVLPCPNDSCAAIDLSSRGRILLVNSDTPYLWTERHGYRKVVDILAEDGVTAPLDFSAVAMSDDGRVIVGQVWDSSSSSRFRWQAFRITLPRKAYD